MCKNRQCGYVNRPIKPARDLGFMKTSPEYEPCAHPGGNMSKHSHENACFVDSSMTKNIDVALLMMIFRNTYKDTRAFSAKRLAKGAMHPSRIGRPHDLANIRNRIDVESVPISHAERGPHAFSTNGTAI